MIPFDQCPPVVTSGNLLSTTKVRLFHDTTGRATLHPKPIVNQRGVETMSVVHQDGPEAGSHKSPKVVGWVVTSRDDGATLQTFEEGDLEARLIVAAYAATPAGILEAAEKAALETKWAVVTKATAWNRGASHVSPATAAAAEALLKSLGF